MELIDLRKPFPPEAVSWRVGSTTKDKARGLALAYIDARDVMDRLDMVCGIGNWQAEPYDGGDGRLACKIGIRVDGEWVWKGDGAGGRQANIGLSEQDANKGDFADAFKRAAVMWGIGRYLYALASPWVELDQYKHIKESEYPKLRALLAGNAKATQHEPAPQPRTEDTAKLFATAERMIRGCVTLDDLEHIKKQPEFKNIFNALNDTDRDRIAEQGRMAARRLGGAMVDAANANAARMGAN